MKKLIICFILGATFGMFILPSVFEWLGLPLPSHGIAYLLSDVFGEPDGFNALFSILVTGVFIVLLLLGGIKLARNLD
ncbi:hypothetical protein [Sporosarcina sp. UB5]|uniref:hypothetical protein n=1 Tax=Sporosarcina sp. UB5 TaxID=3047463 RepID=UPI003D78C6DF